MVNFANCFAHEIVCEKGMESIHTQEMQLTEGIVVPITGVSRNKSN